MHVHFTVLTISIKLHLGHCFLVIFEEFINTVIVYD